MKKTLKISLKINFFDRIAILFYLIKLITFFKAHQWNQAIKK